ncbi:MAG: LD-carboxypeptidase [Alcaligenaceae bacterium]|nr:LD-carboxypeptidase [Alcaligenaceae bacterium SAGV5]MPS52421.1 LD-carboxypeptidase [Alcaligenaceae bacterium SAGV3]MPT58108.1 LD-carboxypeptidase [Alcaligenaceae bacterium]
MNRRRSSSADAHHDHDHDHDARHEHHHGDGGHDHHHDQGSGPGFPPLGTRPGVYLVSPSGAVPDPEVLARARGNLKAQGFHPVADRGALLRQERFAGTDDQRLAALARAAAQKHPIVMATRGGYGLSRILPRIDWKAMADSGKRFVGHSDFTFFQLALLARTGAVSYAGPMAAFDFGGKRVDDLTAAMFGETLRGELEILSFESEDSDAVDCRGVLWGGNLAVLASLLGTPYFPRTRGILFLEDINEHPYRVERMLVQLAQAGVLARQKAIVLGSFTDYKLTPHDAGYDLRSVVEWLRREVKVPVVTGLPFGHVKTKATLPVGAKIGLATEAGMAYLVFPHGH